MSTAWLLKSSTLWAVLVLSGLVSATIFLFSPDGVPSLRKRETDLLDQKIQLQRLRRGNLELAQ